LCFTVNGRTVSPGTDEVVGMMVTILVLAAITALVLLGLRWSADSRTGDDWKRAVGPFSSVGGPLR
jgi:hypothetical protein